MKEKNAVPALVNLPSATDALPPEVSALIRRVDALLRAGDPSQALEIINRAQLASPWVTNAAGVCFLRLGNARQALDTFRGLVLGSGGIILRVDAPAVFRANFATALLLSDNLDGFLSTLSDLRNETHPAVQKLRARVTQWSERFTTWQNLKWKLGIVPAVPFPMDFEPGDLE